MKNKNKPRYNWDVYWDESKSDKAGGRVVITAFIAIGLIIGAGIGLISFGAYLERHLGPLGIAIAIATPLLPIILYYMWPDKMES